AALPLVTIARTLRGNERTDRAMNRSSATAVEVADPRMSCAALAAATSVGSSAKSTIRRLRFARASIAAARSACLDALEKSTPQRIDRSRMASHLVGLPAVERSQVLRALVLRRIRDVTQAHAPADFVDRREAVLLHPSAQAIAQHRHVPRPMSK